MQNDDLDRIDRIKCNYMHSDMYCTFYVIFILFVSVFKYVWW